jgi:hypothetical protein
MLIAILFCSIHFLYSIHSDKHKFITKSEMNIIITQSKLMKLVLKYDSYIKLYNEELHYQQLLAFVQR